jgi:twitching motility protein PilT
MANEEEYMLRDLLEELVSRDGTDLLLSVGKVPQVRIDKNLVNTAFPVLTMEKSKQLCYQVMGEFQQRKLEEEWEVDFSFGIPSLSRFRANVFMQRGAVSGAFRRIPYKIFDFEALHLPSIAKELCDKPHGLVLVTGPTGSGKSSTLAAMVDRINELRQCHIITLEDPIEYIHHHKKCTVDQREIGTDTKEFKSALKSILRQDPDVVLLGEMRDAESIQAALTIAETGHLCFATLHTNSCAQTLSRIVDVFPGDKQSQVRTQLAQTLNGVFTQALVPKIGGGMQLALEIMVATTAVRASIRENKIHSIDNLISTGSKFGMQTMNQSLATAVKNGNIREVDALLLSSDHEEFRKCMIY